MAKAALNRTRLLRGNAAAVIPAAPRKSLREMGKDFRISDFSIAVPFRAPCTSAKISEVTVCIPGAVRFVMFLKRLGIDLGPSKRDGKAAIPSLSAIGSYVLLKYVHFSALEANGPVCPGKKCVVSAHSDVHAWEKLGAALAHQDGAGPGYLALI